MNGGPWVNGGAWIHTPAGKVDFLYRNIDQVERTIHEASQGTVQHDYHQQPPYGFYSVIYLAETHICMPLYDPHTLVTRLKRMVETYPTRLKERTINNALWNAEFTLLHARSFAKLAEVYNTVGCLTRVASSLTQALFALNEHYFISDKRAMEEMGSFALIPAGYVGTLRSILAHPGETAEELGQTVADLEALWQHVVSIAGETYQPRFAI